MDRGQTLDPAQYFWRVDKPVEFMRRYGVGLDVDILSPDRDVDDDTNIVVLPKMRVLKENREEVKKLFDSMKEAGIRLIYDADDDMFSESFVAYNTKLNTKKGMLEPGQVAEVIRILEARRADNVWTLQQCDAATVSTQPLADYVQLLMPDKPVIVVKNAIDVDFMIENTDFDLAFRSADYKTVGWAGGLRLDSDIAPMLEAWEKISIVYGQDVKFCIAGWQPNLEKYQNVRKNLITAGWSDPGNYFNNMQVDIGCVCVTDTLFNNRKSTIKAWEFSIMNAMVVGSQALYGNEVLLAANSVDDWFLILKYYLEFDEDRVRMAELYNKHVRGQYDIQYNWLYWPDAYQKILAMTKKHENNTVRV